MTSMADGSCLCGAVGFAARLPAKWVAHCHCTRCQRAHGAAFVTWVGLQQDDVEITDGQQRLTWFQHDQAGRGFCGRCGSPMFFRSERYPGELHIARALFHDALAQQPQAHAFHGTHVDWATLAEPLPIVPEPDWSRPRPADPQSLK